MNEKMQTSIINVLVTADYELFLGRNFLSDDEVLFHPTEQMVAVCDELNVPITFFADICSVWAHQKFGLWEYVKKFEKQMIQVCSNGHDVQLHLHPHWLYSNYEKEEWQIATERMYLAELGYGTGDEAAPAVIKRGVDYLHRLLQGQKPTYRCLAFRAAGLALQPGDRDLIGALLDNGIMIDSSVIKGVKFSLDTVCIDYSQTPKAANWFMSPETGIEVPANEGVLEIPIGTFKSDFAARVGFIWRRARSVRMRRGAGISRSARQGGWSNLKTLIAYNLRYIYTNPYFSFSCDTKGFNLEMLLRGFDDYVRRHGELGQLYVSMINHPKLLFAPQLELLNSLVTQLRVRYGERIRFITATEALELVRAEKGSLMGK